MRFCFIFLFFFGCLRTHDQIIKEKGSLVPQNLNKELAQIKNRIHLLERNSVSKQDVDSIIENLRKTFTRLEDQITLLSKKQLSQKLEKSSVKAPSSALSLFDQAEKYFKDKQYKKAIFAYEEFRKSKPSSQKFKEATLKMGLSFMSLELKKEAEVFFKEVVDRFPNSKEAKQAQTFLK